MPEQLSQSEQLVLTMLVSQFAQPQISHGLEITSPSANHDGRSCNEPTCSQSSFKVRKAGDVVCESP